MPKFVHISFIEMLVPMVLVDIMGGVVGTVVF